MFRLQRPQFAENFPEFLARSSFAQQTHRANRVVDRAKGAIDDRAARADQPGRHQVL